MELNRLNKREDKIELFKFHFPFIIVGSLVQDNKKEKVEE